MAHGTRRRRAGFVSAILLPALCTSLAACTTSSYPKDADLAQFVPPGTTVRTHARGDLDGDGDQDAIVVIEHDSDHTDSASRELLLLRRDANGILREALRSKSAIPCRECGGMMGADPLQSVRVGHGGFTLRFEGGSRELWSSEYRFAYARNRDLWLLTSIVYTGFDRADGKSAERHLDASEFGEVSLESFDPGDYPASVPLVSLARGLPAGASALTSESIHVYDAKSGRFLDAEIFENDARSQRPSQDT